MSYRNRCTDGKECILCNRKFSQIPLHWNALSSKMTHFRFCQVFLFFLPAANLTTTITTQEQRTLTQNPYTPKITWKLKYNIDWNKTFTQSSDLTCRAVMPSFSMVFTWQTILSSNQSIVMGTLAPHLSQRAVIPHLTAIPPVLLEFGVITPGLASIIVGRSILISDSLKDSDVNLRKKLVCIFAGVLGPTERKRRRKMKPLHAADMGNQFRRLKQMKELRRIWRHSNLLYIERRVHFEGASQREWRHGIEGEETEKSARGVGF